MAATESTTQADDRNDGASIKPAVNAVGRAFAAVPSLGPASKAWTKLGFALSKPFIFHGCNAVDVILASGGLRFVAPAGAKKSTPLNKLVGERLIAGAGLLGWSWACKNVERTREIIEERSGETFEKNDTGEKELVVPSKLNPGATTLLEPIVDEDVPDHPNGIHELDHLVLTVSNSDDAADAYEEYFGLRAKRRTIADKRYAFVDVGGKGGSVIEIVGPAEPDSSRLHGHPWGLAMRSKDLDATVSSLRDSGVHLSDPHDAIQGGRIASLPMHLGGIQIAFLGD